MADENVTDLTEEEGSGSADAGKGKKKEKAPKEPKEKKEKKEKDPKKPGEKGKSNGIAIILVMLLIAVLLVGGYVFALVFNVFSARAITADFVRDPLINFIVWLDPRFSRIDYELRDIAQARENDLNTWEEQLEVREEELLLREGIADTREEQLDRRTVELDKREEEFWQRYERNIPIYRRDPTPEMLEEMESIALTFTQMSPASAAEILYRLYTLQDTAEILFYMTEKNRGAIMDAFDPEFAAEVTNFWMYH